MSREAHVRFWESARVKIPRATRLFLENCWAQKVIKCEPFLLKSGRFLRFFNWHDLDHFGAFKLWQFLR